MTAGSAHVAVVLVLVVTVGWVVSPLLVHKRGRGDGIRAVGSLVVSEIFGIGVGRIERKAVVQPMGDLYLTGVVVSLCSRAARRDGIEVREWVSAQRLASG